MEVIKELFFSHKYLKYNMDVVIIYISIINIDFDLGRVFLD